MRALEDVRIVALEQYGAGPWASVHLADLGADVIKIEDPRVGGDVGRYIPPFQEGEDSLFFEAFNRNKRSLSLDVTTTSGRAVFEDLVRVSDVVFSNLRGDVPAKLRIRYEDLAAINPSIVCCSLSAYGMTGPRLQDPGYDYILQGLTGWMSLTGEPGGPPTKTGLSLVDYTGGFVAAMAILAGLHAARRDGVGLDCDVSLFDTAISLLNYPAAWHLNGGFEPERTRHSAHPSLVPFQNHRDELIAILDALFATRPAGEWLDLLDRAGVPAGPVAGVAEALADPQVEARAMMVETDHPRFGRVRQVASPLKVGDTPAEYRRAPRRHEDAPDVLGGLLDYDDERIAALESAGAFGALPGTATAP
ncbi:MAG: CoA transferase [Actinobacteria bacterium]|nr:CoA transferase [Actinomycetota bacterium]